MKLITFTMACLLIGAELASAGGAMWTRESYDKAIQSSSVVFNAKVVGKSQEYFQGEKKLEITNKSDLTKHFKTGKEHPVVHTKVTLEVISVDKGDSVTVGQKIEVEWEDAAFVLCPHPENTALNGDIRKWRNVGETFKVLPDTIYKKVGNNYAPEQIK